MTRKNILAILTAFTLIPASVLAADGPSLPGIDDLPAPSESQTLPSAPDSVPGLSTPDNGKGSITAQGVLSSSVNYTLYANGDLVLAGHDLVTPLKDEPAISSRISAVKKLIIGSGVTSIGKDTCKSLTSLTAVEIGNDTKLIGEYAFSDCTALKSVDNWGGVTEIGRYAFKGCTTLERLELDSIEILGESAFYGCSSLNDVSIGSELKLMGQTVFNSCNALVSISFNCPVPDFAMNGCAALNSVVLGQQATSIGNYAFKGCSALTSVQMNNATASIGINAFEGCTSILQMSFGSELKVIGSNAFTGCTSLAAVTLPDELTDIGDYCFSGCTGLMSVKLPARLARVGSHAFDGCSKLSAINLDDSASNNQELTIGDSAFMNCTGLINISVNASSIGNQAFSGCTSLRAVTLRAVEIGRNLFDNCSLDKLTISMHTIPNEGFLGVKAKTIVLSSEVQGIGSNAFEDNSATTKLIIPDGITDIGDYAFRNCSALEFVECDTDASIALPQTLTSMGKRIFDGCGRLKTLCIAAPVIGEESLANTTGLQTFTVTDSVTTIKQKAFSGCESLREVDLREDGLV